jgi:cytochrome-b5 reductase
MSKANYDPPSLTGNPVRSLVPPGMCQFTEEWTSVPLLERVKVSPTSSVLRFGLPDKSMPLNLSTCACILARAKLPATSDDNSDKENDGELEDVVRPYTPISTNELKGCFDLLIKDYGEHGRMSHHMCNAMKVGDEIDFKHIEFNVKIQAPFSQKTICMLVGGTGITPMIQALHAILGDKDAGNNVVMFYGNKSSNDILGKTMVDSWAKEFGDRFQVHHVLSDEPSDSDWKGHRGFINRELIEKNVPGPDVGDDLIFFICGPPPMYDALTGPRGEDEISGVLKEMGYKKQQVYKF